MTAGQRAGSVIKYTISNGDATTSKSVSVAEVPYTYYEGDRYTIVRPAFYRSMQK
jgi:spore coat polysaccharide biosynthesis predicted glycosyltransferase SpsG